MREHEQLNFVVEDESNYGRRGREYWCIENKDPCSVHQSKRYHCVDGPAILWDDGARSWWIDGRWYGTHTSNQPFNNIYFWAKAALEYQNMPHDDNAVKQYVLKVLNKMTDEEI